MFYFNELRRPSDNSTWPVIYLMKPVESRLKKSGQQKYEMLKRLYDANDFLQEGHKQVVHQTSIIKKKSSLIKKIFKEGYTWKD